MQQGRKGRTSDRQKVRTSWKSFERDQKKLESNQNTLIKKRAKRSKGDQKVLRSSKEDVLYIVGCCSLKGDLLDSGNKQLGKAQARHAELD